MERGAGEVVPVHVGLKNSWPCEEMGGTKGAKLNASS